MSGIMDILINLLSFLWNITKVLIPIMIVIEIFKDTKLIDKISDFFYPVTKFFTLSKISGISLIFGMFFGLTLGAGAILQSVKDYNVDKRSVFLVAVFLSPCHAIFEDAFIMKAAGSNILPLLAARFISAIAATYIFSRALKNNKIDIVNISNHEK